MTSGRPAVTLVESPTERGAGAGRLISRARPNGPMSSRMVGGTRDFRIRRTGPRPAARQQAMSGGRARSGRASRQTCRPYREGGFVDEFAGPPSGNQVDPLTKRAQRASVICVVQPVRSPQVRCMSPTRLLARSRDSPLPLRISRGLRPGDTILTDSPT